MSPLHHHFELGGWAETKITLRFWIVAVLAGLLGRHALPGHAPEARVNGDGPRSTSTRSPSTPCAPGPWPACPRPSSAWPARASPSPASWSTPGARVTVYDGKPADELAEAIAAPRGAAGRPRLRAGRRTRPRPGPARRSSPSARRSRRASRRPSRACARRSTRWPPRRRPATRTPRRSCPSRTSSCASAPRRPSGVTGTKGKTTTASLAAHLLAGRPASPGRPRRATSGRRSIDRLDDLTPDHRVVVELSELQLPSLSRGTTVAALHERHVRSPRPPRVARGLPGRQATPGRARRPRRRPRPQPRRPGRRRRTPAWARRPRSATASERPIPGGLGIVDGWVVAAGVERLPLAGGGAAATGPGGRILPVGELPAPGPAQPLEPPRRGRGRAPLRRRSRRASGARRRASGASSTASSWSRRSTGSASSTTRRGRSPTPSRRPCGASRRRSSSSPAAATRASTWRRSARSRPSALPPPCSSARAGRPWAASSGRRACRASRTPGRWPSPCPRADAIARELLADAPAGHGRHGAPLAGGRELRPVPRLRRPRPRLQGRRRGARRGPRRAARRS